MPNYDLTTSDLGFVANQAVDILRIANVDVWTKPADATPETVFNAATLTLTSNHDSGVNDWEGNQFNKYAGGDLEVLSLGIYIPVGSELIGASGTIGLQLGASRFQSPTTYLVNIVGVHDLAIASLVQGWNWFDYSTPVVWPDATPWMVAAYKISGGKYLHDGSSVTSSPVVSTGAHYELVADTWRSWYTFGSNSFQSASGRTYGIDVKARPA